MPATPSLRPLTQGGVRLGTLAMTTRGFVEADFSRVADMLHRCINIAKKVESRSVVNKLTHFKAALEGDKDVEALQLEVCISIPFFYYYYESCTVKPSRPHDCANSGGEVGFTFSLSMLSGPFIFGE